MKCHPSRTRRRRGSALMLVVVATSMVLSAWAVANHRTDDLLLLKELQAQRVSGHLATISDTRSLAFEAACIGLAHLEVAAPPQQTDTQKKGKGGGTPLSYSAFKCTFATVQDSPVYVVKFTFDDTTSLWTVDVIASDLWDGPPALDDLTELSGAF